MTVPWELQVEDQWVNWRWSKTADSNGRANLTKVPLTPGPVLYKAKSNDWTTWRSYDAACKWAKVHGVGIGFALTPPFVGIDIDKCCDEIGSIHPVAQAIVDEAQSYTEYSITGSGLHIIGVSDEELEKGFSINSQPWDPKRGKVEGWNHHRFMVMSSWQVPGTAGSTLQPLDSLVRRFRAEGRGQATEAGKTAGTGSVQRVRRRKSPDQMVAGDSRHQNLRALAGGLICRGEREVDKLQVIIAEENQKFPRSVGGPIQAQKFAQDWPRTIEWILEQEGRKQAFWQETDVLKHIHQHARASFVAPLSLLGSCLARVNACIPYQVVLPPRGRGGRNYGSLNLFIMLLGTSGSGKDQSYGESKVAITLPGIDIVEEIRLGTGEGLALAFKGLAKTEEQKRIADKDGEFWKRRNVLVYEGELESINKIVERGGQTLVSEARNGWSGGILGTRQIVDEKRMRHVDAMEYRLTMILCTQPANAGTFLMDEQGGSPQRFAWWPCYDPEAEFAAPVERPAKPLTIDVPYSDVRGSDKVVVPVADSIMEEIITAARRQVAGKVLDARRKHWLFHKERVAYTLAAMHEQRELSERWWDLAGWLMERSAEGERLALWERSQDRHERDVVVAARAGRGEAVKELALAENREQLCRDWVLKTLGSEGDVKRERLRSIKHYRDVLDDVLKQLLNTGVIEQTAPSRPVYRLARR